jgi:pimeloyl-ACP methyl ester carboxylesterase
MAADRSSPSAWGLGEGEEVWLEAGDGVRIHGWWVPSASPRRRGTLLFLHGNAGNIAGRARLARDLAAAGLDVFLLDYRGYGRSEGRPSEEGLYLDAGAAYLHLREERGVTAGELVVAGHSLGGAVAAHLASSRSVGATVVTASFTDLADAARAVYPWLPDAWFRWSPSPFATVRRMARLDAPVLVGRGAADRLIPGEQVRALYEAAPEPRRWVEIPGAGHGDLWLDGAFIRELLDFTDRHLEGPRPDEPHPDPDR